MAVVRPLAAVRYDPARVGDLARVVAPPYDVISPAQQAALYDASPYNVVRLILAREADRAATAAATLRAWLDAGVLRQDGEPGLYVYVQTFRLPDGAVQRREGIICRLGLEEFASGVVRPHERTFPGPKADRLALLRATAANLSPIFGLYAQPGVALRDWLGPVTDMPPVIDIRRENGDTDRLWRVTDAAAIARVQAALAPHTMFIADGHHRYETALNYWKEQGRPESASCVLAFVANMDQEGLVILPTHRLVRAPLALDAASLAARLTDRFVVEPLPARPRVAGEIDCVLPDRRLRLRARPGTAAGLRDVPEIVRGLDLSLLHGAILEPLLHVRPEALAFTHDDAEATRAVETGAAAAAFLLNAPSLAEVRAVCLAGELMPEKSTYFYPKLASGLVFSPVGPPWV
jgi:uncharacterized protein (DUF1015 family)